MMLEIEPIIKIVLAFILGAIVGLERELSRKPAGLRTNSLVGLGAALFTILSYDAFPGGDPSRIAAGVVVGVGFLGAGTIVKSQEKVRGLTTAATLWTVASIGVTVGAGYYALGIVATALAYIALKLDVIENAIKKRKAD
ncbi:MAG: MgtC/SapB family protein [Candidatus Bathyarchaeota archaeon]|nr:MgtC/SapB family protein [Candidatus Bathyarchaeum tardum]WGM89778.1 MAG: MgtC/SapB family protein [Candidatus Bathyarchaeum tardum]